MHNDILDFEDLIEIYTPGSIDRKVLMLDAAWQLLKRKYPQNDYIQTEVKAWEVWAREILDSSWVYKTLPTGIMEEIDKWEQRYKQVYLSAPDKHHLVQPDIIAPDSIFQNPMFWVFAGLALGTGIYFYARAKR